MSSPGSARLAPTADEVSALARTTMAWSRSGLANIAFGAAIAKGLPMAIGNPAQPALGLVVVALGVLSIAVGNVSARRRARAGVGTIATLSDLVPLTACATGMGVVVFALILVA